MHAYAATVLQVLQRLCVHHVLLGLIVLGVGRMWMHAMQIASGAACKGLMM
jgi:hypothetical protein